MHSTTLFGIFAVVAASASLVACGSDTGSTSTTGGGGSASTSSTSDTATSTTSTSATTSSASGTGGGAPAMINGCDPTALEDHTADATVEIKFGDMTGLVYAPPCIKVKSGTMVTFTGNFGIHPLAGGEVIMGKPATADDKSPIKPTSGAMPSVSFDIAPAGNYPYFCTEHYSIGMKGLIVAE
jgi:plastocyanin